MDYTVHGILQARILEWVAFPFFRGPSQPRVEPRSPTLQVDSLPAEPQGKPKNTGESSLSLLQWIFLTQESNWGLLHYRHTLKYRRIHCRITVVDAGETFLRLNKKATAPENTFTASNTAGLDESSPFKPLILITKQSHLGHCWTDLCTWTNSRKTRGLRVKYICIF